jgi:transposase
LNVPIHNQDVGRVVQHLKIVHTLEGLSNLLDFIREVEAVSGGQPPIVLESTGHYHTPLVQYFEDRRYLMIIVNPPISS